MSSLVRRTARASVLALLVLPAPLSALRPAVNRAAEFAFLDPWFDVSASDRDQLAQGGVVVKGLPAAGRQIAVIAVCSVALSADDLVRRVHIAGEVKRGELVAGRFDDPPTLHNLARLSLDEGDLDRLRRCRPGDCRLNLADDEMAAVQQALAAGGGGASGRSQQAFRQIIFDRLRRYLTGGLSALADYHDRRDPVSPATVFAEIVEQSSPLRTHFPDVTTYLSRFPFGPVKEAESLLHWSKMIINHKAVVMVTHVSIFRPAPAPRTPAVLVAGKQVYASRYMNGELRLTMLFEGAEGSRKYLVHVNRSDLDELGGTFSGLKRAVIESRIKEEASEALTRLRDALGRGE